MDIDALKHIYFLGIGGIGMSAVARYFNRKGVKISGYDKTETMLTKKLVTENIEIHYTEDVSKVPGDIDLVVYTPAIPKTNKEWQYVQNLDIPILKRSEMLGLISKAKRCVAIAGTHGKTTTSSMIAHLLKHSGIDISCFLGGIANNFNSNYCYGESDWAVIEADEFDRSFHTLSPEIAVLISMDPDHLDIYGKKENMQESFEHFLLKIKPGGVALVNRNLVDKFSDSFLEELRKRKIILNTYGSEDCDFVLSDIEYENGVQKFRVSENGKSSSFMMMMPGEHNASNMNAAIGVSKLIGVHNDLIYTGVKTFSGIQRRFEIHDNGERIYVDDYAHHPTELRAAIQSAKKLWPGKRILVVFQPHLYSRTRDFMKEFAEELGKVDELYLMEIYPARELPIKGINSKFLLEKIELNDKMIVQKKVLMDMIRKGKFEVLMTLGAGDIDVYASQIREWMDKND